MRSSYHSGRKAPPLGIALQAAGAIGACIGGLGVDPAAAQAVNSDATEPGHEKAKATGLGEVVVTGIRPLLGDKIPLTIQDTPQSVNVVPQRLLEQQSITRLEDALKNVPGVTLNAGEGAARGDTINIRGFSAFNDFFLDGIRDAAIYVRDPFNLDSIEVLKGPFGDSLRPRLDRRRGQSGEQGAGRWRLLAR